MRRDPARLLDMLLSARAVLEFTNGVSVERFMSERMIQSAVVREIEVIGEAARAVGDETRQQHPEIPWAQIIGMRNRIVHQYFDVRWDVVWDVVQKDIPALIPLLAAIVPTESEDDDGTSPPPPTQKSDPTD